MFHTDKICDVGECRNRATNTAKCVRIFTGGGDFVIERRPICDADMCHLIARQTAANEGVILEFEASA